MVVVSRSAGARESSDPRVEYRSVRDRDREQMSEVIAGASVVYDLAMPLGSLWEDWERGVIAGGINVAEACLENMCAG